MIAQTTLAAALEAAHDGPIWGTASEQLNATLMRLRAGDGIAPHVNNEVDVLLVVLAGAGELLLGGEWQTVAAGKIALIPRGETRATRSGDEGLVYLTCHQRRKGLMPT